MGDEIKGDVVRNWQVKKIALLSSIKILINTHLWPDVGKYRRRDSSYGHLRMFLELWQPWLHFLQILLRLDKIDKG